MKKSEKFRSKNRLSTFSVSNDTTNEKVLELVYKDFSKKIEFLKQVYPYSDGSMHSYVRMQKHFGIDYDYYWDDNIEYFTDTYEENKKAFDEGIFPCSRDYFGKGEFPIFLIERRHNNSEGAKDIIAYDITR